MTKIIVIQYAHKNRSTNMLDTKKFLCPINLLTAYDPPMECREKSAMLNIDYPAGSKHPGNLFYLRMHIKYIISVRIRVGEGMGSKLAYS